MDLRQLRHFLSVAEELHFGRAAERLGMTQPPLSQSIQALESELGVQLFVRTKRSVALTPVGQEWLAHARAVLDKAAGLPETARRLSRGELGSLRLAFVSTADYSVLPGMVSRFRQSFPHVAVSLREATSDIQIEAVLTDEIDVGMIIAPDRKALQATLNYRPLLREPLVAAVPEAWIAARRPGFTAETLRAEAIMAAPLILFPRHIAPAFHDIVSGYFAEHGAPLAVHQEAIQMQTIIGLVAAGMGIALVPQSMTNLRRRGAHYLPLQDSAPEIETGLVWRAANSSPTLQRFLEIAS
ncbi:LysR family transcriptional regulator [Bosea sp. 2YAB26]|uniref:LysR family transcriptional regulator n=1 Tax=Bosea sp. 2YAB26 TaxID=3237478 RepID=UPI003F8D9CD5